MKDEKKKRKRVNKGAYDSFRFNTRFVSGGDYKLFMAFKKALIKELQNNPDGVQLPLARVTMTKKLCDYKLSNCTLRKKYGEGYGIVNDNTDGHLITTQVKMYSSIENWIRTSLHATMFKFRPNMALKNAQKEVADDGRWVDLNYFTRYYKK